MMRPSSITVTAIAKRKDPKGSPTLWATTSAWWTAARTLPTSAAPISKGKTGIAKLVNTTNQAARGAAQDQCWSKRAANSALPLVFADPTGVTQPGQASSLCSMNGQLRGVARSRPVRIARRRNDKDIAISVCKNFLGYTAKDNLSNAGSLVRSDDEEVGTEFPSA